MGANEEHVQRIQSLLKHVVDVNTCLEVKASTVAGAGMGCFATCPLAKGNEIHFVGRLQDEKTHPSHSIWISHQKKWFNPIVCEGASADIPAPFYINSVYNGKQRTKRLKCNGRLVYKNNHIRVNLVVPVPTGGEILADYTW